LTLDGLEAEQGMLAQRIERFGALSDPMEIWRALGLSEAQAHAVPMLEAAQFVALTTTHRVKG
jgi:malonate decarboxylase beta subunit